MTRSDISGHLPDFIVKMKKEGLQPIVMDTFAFYYHQVISGETGLIPDRDIQPVPAGNIPHLNQLNSYASAGEKIFKNTVRIILNGGLGTSMGLTGPKSLITVRKGKSFLELLLDRISEYDITLALMNSFSTHEQTISALKKLNPAKTPVNFIQHKFPKILQNGFKPASWPANPELEWNPPGHGDIYTALMTSGILDRFLESGITFAFISNSDNLGASMNSALLGYFAENNFPFMMEAARRTPADVKGGHLALHNDGHMLLRESAQCPPDERDAFMDINKYRFFNTNNLWVNLKFLKELIHEQHTVRLPMILNPKNLDPRDENSPKIFQVETAMGTAISLFPGAAAVSVPRSRFFPVKKCSDLLLIRSDYFLSSDKGNLVLNPDRHSDDIKIKLDSRYFEKVDMFEQRFAHGAPSLKDCESFTVEGDVCFEGGVKIQGQAVVRNRSEKQARVKAGTVINGMLEI